MQPNSLDTMPTRTPHRLPPLLSEGRPAMPPEAVRVAACNTACCCPRGGMQRPCCCPCGGPQSSRRPSTQVGGAKFDFAGGVHFTDGDEYLVSSAALAAAHAATPAAPVAARLSRPRPLRPRPGPLLWPQPPPLPQPATSWSRPPTSRFQPPTSLPQQATSRSRPPTSPSWPPTSRFQLPTSLPQPATSRFLLCCPHCTRCSQCGHTRPRHSHSCPQRGNDRQRQPGHRHCCRRTFDLLGSGPGPVNPGLPLPTHWPWCAPLVSDPGSSTHPSPGPQWTWGAPSSTLTPATVLHGHPCAQRRRGGLGCPSSHAGHVNTITS